MESNHREHGNALLNRPLLESFIDLHRAQLQLSGVPARFYDNLLEKLQQQVQWTGNAIDGRSVN